MKYLYENHLGGVFITDTELTYDECYCEQCGDSDRMIGLLENNEDIKDALIYIFDNYGDDYTRAFVDAYLNDMQKNMTIEIPVLPMKQYEHLFFTNPDTHDKTYVRCDKFDYCNTFDVYGEVRCEDYCLQNFEYELVRLNPWLSDNCPERS